MHTFQLMNVRIPKVSEAAAALRLFCLRFECTGIGVCENGFQLPWARDDHWRTGTAMPKQHPAKMG